MSKFFIFISVFVFVVQFYSARVIKDYRLKGNICFHHQLHYRQYINTLSLYLYNVIV